jgi:glutathione S-transferase
MQRLITLAFSHYNEKARWALDWCGVKYHEDRYLPGFSQLAVLAATRGRGGRADRVSTRMSTPVLVTEGGRALCDSTDIARWASATLALGGDGPLFPEPSVGALVDELGVELGPYVRLLAYFHVMRAPGAMDVLATENVGRGQALAFRVLAPLGRRYLTRARQGASGARSRRGPARGENVPGRRPVHRGGPDVRGSVRPATAG